MNARSRTASCARAALPVPARASARTTAAGTPRLALRAALALVLLAALPACGSARRGEAFGGPATPFVDDPALREGQVLFARHCHRCHPHGEGGLGPSLNEKPLPRWAMRTQVRHGFGAMPAFDDELTDDEIAALADYLVAWRRQPHDG